MGALSNEAVLIKEQGNKGVEGLEEEGGERGDGANSRRVPQSPVKWMRRTKDGLIKRRKWSRATRLRAPKRICSAAPTRRGRRWERRRCITAVVTPGGRGQPQVVDWTSTQFKSYQLDIEKEVQTSFSINVS